MCNNSSTASGTTSLSPQAQQDYQHVYDRVNDVSQTPYQPYGGSRVAGFNDWQTGAFTQSGGVQDAGKSAIASGIGAAGNVAGFTPQSLANTNLQPYMNPYNQDVVNSTVGELNRQGAINQQNIKANAALSGSFGGDRTAIAEQEANRNLATVTGNTVAGLNAANFSQAQNAANSDIGNSIKGGALDLAGAQALGSLGGQQQQQQLLGAQALLGTGNQIQQQQQQNLNTAYQDFQNQVQWPYQNASFLANAVNGNPLSKDTNTTSTTPGPSVTSQVGGGLLALAGTGAVGNNGYLYSTNSNSGLLNSLFGNSSNNLSNFSFAPLNSADGGIVGYASGGDVQPQSQPQEGGWEHFTKSLSDGSVNPLLLMGLSIMGGDSPYAMTNIGKGAVAGIGASQKLQGEAAQTRAQQAAAVASEQQNEILRNSMRIAQQIAARRNGVGGPTATGPTAGMASAANLSGMQPGAAPPAASGGGSAAATSSPPPVNLTPQTSSGGATNSVQASQPPQLDARSQFAKDREYDFDTMYEYAHALAPVNPEASQKYMSTALANDPRVKLSQTAAGQLLVMGGDGRLYNAPGVVYAKAQNAMAEDQAKSKLGRPGASYIGGVLPDINGNTQSTAGVPGGLPNITAPGAPAPAQGGPAAAPATPGAVKQPGTVATDQPGGMRHVAGMPGNFSTFPLDPTNASVPGLSKEDNEQYTKAMTGLTEGTEGNAKLSEVDRHLDSGIPLGKGAETWTAAAGWLNQAMPGVFENPERINNAEAFQKYVTQYATIQARKMGAGEAASVVNMFLKANPNQEMTEGGIRSILGSLRGMNDYFIAKGQAAANWRATGGGNMQMFEAHWLANTSPESFVAPYITKDEWKNMNTQMQKRYTAPPPDATGRITDRSRPAEPSANAPTPFQMNSNQMISDAKAAISAWNARTDLDPKARADGIAAIKSHFKELGGNEGRLK